METEPETQAGARHPSKGGMEQAVSPRLTGRGVFCLSIVRTLFVDEATLHHHGAEKAGLQGVGSVVTWRRLPVFLLLLLLLSAFMSSFLPPLSLSPEGSFYRSCSSAGRFLKRVRWPSESFPKHESTAEPGCASTTDAPRCRPWASSLHSSRVGRANAADAGARGTGLASRVLSLFRRLRQGQAACVGMCTQAFGRLLSGASVGVIHCFARAVNVSLGVSRKGGGDPSGESAAGSSTSAFCSLDDNTDDGQAGAPQVPRLLRALVPDR